MWRLELEEEILKEAIPDWDSFLFSNEIYWQLNLSNKEFSSAERRVRISAGRLLISFYLLNHLDQSEGNLIADRFRLLKNEWSANWQKKAINELPVRLRQWNQFVDDLRVDADFSQPQLQNQLQIRLMVGLLMDDINADEGDKFLSLLESLDLRYKQLTIKNNFVWEEELAEIFPYEKFWYLYRKLRPAGGKQ